MVHRSTVEEGAPPRGPEVLLRTVSSQLPAARGDHTTRVKRGKKKSFPHGAPMQQLVPRRNPECSNSRFSTLD